MQQPSPADTYIPPQGACPRAWPLRRHRGWVFWRNEQAKVRKHKSPLEKWRKAQ